MNPLLCKELSAVTMCLKIKDNSNSDMLLCASIMSNKAPAQHHAHDSHYSNAGIIATGLLQYTVLYWTVLYCTTAPRHYSTTALHCTALHAPPVRSSITITGKGSGTTLCGNIPAAVSRKVPSICRQPCAPRSWYCTHTHTHTHTQRLRT